MKTTPLVMFPNGALARSDTVPEGCVIVEESEYVVPPAVEDQTAAVLEAENDSDLRDSAYS